MNANAARAIARKFSQKCEKISKLQWLSEPPMGSSAFMDGCLFFNAQYRRGFSGIFA
jgi:hypothetical protein